MLVHGGGKGERGAGGSMGAGCPLGGEGVRGVKIAQSVGA